MDRKGGGPSASIRLTRAARAIYRQRNPHTSFAWTYLPLRRRILDARATLPIDLWAYDVFWPEGVREPSGARASALYSVAQRMRTWRQNEAASKTVPPL